MKPQQAGSSRNCWRSPRERKRLRARFEIRERVAAGVIVVAKDDKKTTQIDEQLAKTFLRNVSDGSVASFSLSNLSKHVALLTSPIPSSLLSEYKITTLCTSRYGPNHAQQVLVFCSARETCTAMEYAVLLGEFKVVGALLLGGILPTVSGAFKGDSRVCSNNVSVRIQNRFFDCFPLSLSTYIVKRVVEMRFQGWKQTGGGNLCFGEPCMHSFDEELIWVDLLNHMDDRSNTDVVWCPICGAKAPSQGDHQDQDEDELSSPAQRAQDSLNRYLALPATTRDLKARPRKAPKKLVLTRSWQQAVSQSLGNSQDVRRDKFFSHVDRGAWHHVRGCLRKGIDVNLINEYGQTALFIAVWKGFEDIVELLLFFGADQSICANGGSSARSLAIAKQHTLMIDLLNNSADKRSTNGSNFTLFHAQEDMECSTTNLTVLLPTEHDHPGAGSYVIDETLAEEHLDSLIQLKRILPVALTDRKKQKNIVECSSRFYYCDCSGWICNLLETAIVGALSTHQAKVLPHMRFLEYEHAGSVLVPHVDLCRIDAGRRSTHTFILYLYTCNSGGETVLLRELTSLEAIACVTPRRGRLLLFPHNCPHMGAEVVDLPKLLLRGEVILEPKLTL